MMVRAVVLPLQSVNTSLSGTLFFSICWCMRKMCTSIPGCMQRLSHLTNSGGQHGKESEEGESEGENKEGEEDEERGEEDCEEDPQGRQEEEVSSLLESPAA